ncbi:unnamed protein product [Caenorhabditis nigoni]
MPKMLTQLSSICVLEYLSFEKRQYIVSQIPGLRKVEKSLPLHLDYLKISTSGIRIDQYEYCLTTVNNLGVWTIELRKRHFQSPDSTVLALVPPIQDNVQKTFKKLVFDLIGNRLLFFTKKLELRDSWIYLIPVDVKIQAEIIETRWFCYNYGDLDHISNFLGSKPLKEFSTNLWSFEMWTYPFVRNSEKLVLCRVGVDIDHQRIIHRHIHLKDYDRQTLINEMNAWIANGPGVGMEFSGDIQVSGEKYRELTKSDIDEEEMLIKGIMYSKKCESNGERVKPDERIPNTVYSISMPQTNNPNTEIQMSLIKNTSTDSPSQIHLNIQPSGTAIPEQSDSMYWKLKLWEIRNIFKSENITYFICFMSLLYSFFFIPISLLYRLKNQTFEDE